jgi:hypothetical protein
MRLPAVGKNIQLSVFCESVQHFFTEQGYQSSVHPTKEGCYVIGRPISPKDKRPPVVVLVEGEPNEFTIEFTPAKPDSVGAGTRISASLIGTIAGLEIIKSSVEQERYMELEKLFWDYVKHHINDLTQSEK